MQTADRRLKTEDFLGKQKTKKVLISHCDNCVVAITPY